ncbi:MAG: peptidoglycan DD-metalloendopeptidase family protein [Candidatus Parcubacteria bacterium]|nr:peptidoglycan DD-metalloendopeptidase family protein [Candidatus Paceibacterota bacterium]
MTNPRTSNKAFTPPGGVPSVVTRRGERRGNLNPKKGELIDIRDAKIDSTEKTKRGIDGKSRSIISPDNIIVTGTVTATVEQQGNLTNNALIQPPIAIPQPPIEESLVTSGYSGSTGGEPLVGLVNRNSGDADYNGIQDQTQTRVGATAQQGDLKQTSQNYSPNGGRSISNQGGVQTSVQTPISVTAAEPSSGKHPSIIEDQRAIMGAVAQTPFTILQQINAEKFLNRIGYTREKVQDIVDSRDKLSGTFGNYYEDLILFTDQAIRAELSKLGKEKIVQPSSQVKGADGSKKPLEDPKQGFVPGFRANNFRPTAPQQGSLRPPSPSPSIGSLLESAPVQPSESSSVANPIIVPSDTQKPLPQESGTNASEDKPIIPAQGGIDPSGENLTPDSGSQPTNPLEFGNPEGTGGTGVDNFTPVGRENSGQSQTPGKKPDGPNRDPFFEMTDPNTGQVAQYPLSKDNPDYQPTPDTQGNLPETNPFPYSGQSPEKQAEMRQESQAEIERQKEENENTNQSDEDKDAKREELGNKQNALSQEAQRADGGNPAGDQKSKLRQAAEGKIRDMILKVIAPYVAWAVAVIFGILILATIFIALFQTYADAFYCKDGLSRFVAGSAVTLSATLNPVLATVAGYSTTLTKCKNDAQNSANANCSKPGSATTGSVIVSGCITKAIEGKADNDIVLMWKANAGVLSKDAKIPVAAIRKVISTFQKTGLPEKEINESVVFVTTLMATETAGSLTAWDTISKDPTLRCIGVAQLCPNVAGAAHGMEEWMRTAGIPIDPSLASNGYGLTGSEENHIKQAKVINAGRKEKIAFNVFGGRSNNFKIAALWLGAGPADKNQTRPEQYGEAAENNYNELFASCLGTGVKTASNPIPNTYASLDKQFREAMLAPTVQSDTKWFNNLNPFAGVEALAQGYTGRSVDGLLQLPIEGLGAANNAAYEGDSGADLAVPFGTPVRAAANGTIIYSENGHTPWGTSRNIGVDTPGTILIELDNSVVYNGLIYKYLWYTHLSKLAITQSENAVGSKIKVNDYLGNTGKGNNNDHLHFGILINRSQNDGEFMPPNEVIKYLGLDKDGVNASGSNLPNPNTKGGANIRATDNLTGTPNCAGGYTSINPSTINFGDLGNSGVKNPGGFIRPVDKKVAFTSPFGWRWGRPHNGVDLAGPTGTSIYASKGGTVTIAFNDNNFNGGFGNYVTIKHLDGTETLYGHNDKVSVRVGQVVSQGDRIAEMGSTGHSTGPHLHFEIHIGGTAVDPCFSIKCEPE